MERKIVVHLNRSDTYSHLVAICNQDSTYGILKADTEKDFDSLTVCDYQAAIQNYGSQRGTIIGTLRLLPMDDSTAIIFEEKDSLWHLPISSRGKELFHQFEELVYDHFINLNLTLLQHGAGNNEDNIYIPVRLKSLNDWKVRWSRVKPKYEEGVEYEKIRKYLNDTCGLETSIRTLNKIINAGLAGRLD
jgi:hypothetical protein